MAVATAYTAINMNNWTFYSTASYPIANSTHIQENASGGSIIHYYGTGFTFSAGGDVTGGTLTRVTQTEGLVRYDVTGLSKSAVTVDNYIESANENLLFSFLFSGNDTFNGSGFADQLNGFNGNDTMDGKGGADRIDGGAGNDIIIYGAGDVLNGAAGLLDTLKIKVANVDLSNNTANPNTRLLNFEQLDMRTGDHTLKIGKADVLDMSSTSTLTILGDAGDTVNFVGTQVAGGTAPAGFTRYTVGSAILIIDSDVVVM
jgi:Ca2+-binding RTX toxin-like protein